MNIYIGNLSKGVTEESLRESFEHLGLVDDVKIVVAADEMHQKDFAVIRLMPGEKNVTLAARKQALMLETQR